MKYNKDVGTEKFNNKMEIQWLIECDVTLEQYVPMILS